MLFRSPLSDGEGKLRPPGGKRFAGRTRARSTRLRSGRAQARGGQAQARGGQANNGQKLGSQADGGREKGQRMKIRTEPLAKIKPYERNPRKNDQAVAAVAESIRQCGYVAPIIVDEHFTILAGHTRWKALQQLGHATAQVCIVEGLSEEQKRKYRILDNKTGELAEWDDDLLRIELDGLDFDGFDFGLLDLQTETAENAPPEITEDEFDAEPPEEPKAKRGDIYRLGRHKLMCGDSTAITDVEALIDGERIQLSLTDPPYGISVVKGNRVGGSGVLHFDKVGGKKTVNASTYMAIKGDGTRETAEASYGILQSLTDNQIIFGGNYFTDFLPPSRCWVVWDKENTGNFADAELAWTSFDKCVRLYHFMWNGCTREGSRAVEGVHRVHPTQKPVGMLASILRDFSEAGDNILDCFGGSGSTLIACEQTGRNCFMMEYEPHYVDVIIDRWEQLTGEKAVLIDGV